MILHDTKFPDDLLFQCKEYSGQGTATKAVRLSLQAFFVLRDSHEDLLREYNQLQAKFDCLQAGVLAREAGEKTYRIALRRVNDPNFFALESEEIPRRKRK